MLIAHKETVNAPPAKVWEALVDVERWPEFAPQFKSIQRNDEGPLAEGKVAKVTPHGFPGSNWTVTRFEEGTSFLWEADFLPGLHLAADHVIEPEGDGTELLLSLESSGPLATMLSLVLRRIFSRNVRQEGEGLKAYVEGGSG